MEFAGLGIRANAVAPGPVETAMAKAVHSPAIRADYHDAIPLARYGLEEELANAIYFLSSPQASYITGQVLAVDGGFDAAGIGLPTLRRTEAIDDDTPELSGGDDGREHRDAGRRRRAAGRPHGSAPWRCPPTPTPTATSSAAG